VTGIDVLEESGRMTGKERLLSERSVVPDSEQLD